MKVAVLGGSTPHTVGLAEALLQQRRQVQEPMEVVLVGRQEQRLTAVTEYCQRRTRFLGAEDALHFSAQLNPVAACEGADIVVFQVRPGGLDARSGDESFPLDFGIPGDEGLGPGGLAAAIRGTQLFPQFQAALDAAGKAPVLMLTNPLGLCGRWFEQHHHGPVLGVCELPAVVLRQVLGHAPNAATRADYCGMNHQGFWTRIQQNGVDLLPQALENAPAWARHPDLHGALPLPYWRLLFHREQEVKMQRQRTSTRALALTNLCIRLEQECLANDGSTPLPSGEERAKPWYDMVVAPMLWTSACAESSTLFANTPAQKGHAFAPQGVFVERLTAWGADGISTQDSPPPQKLHSLLTRIAVSEDVAWQACCDPNSKTVSQALRLHPLCDHLSNQQVQRLADQVLQHTELTCV